MTSKSDPSAYQWALVLIIVALFLAVLGEVSAQIHGANTEQLTERGYSYADPMTYIPDPAYD